MFWFYFVFKLLWCNQFRPIYGDYGYPAFPYPWKSRTHRAMRPRNKERPSQPQGSYG